MTPGTQPRTRWGDMVATTTRCRQCEAENPLTSRFCSSCGARLEAACAECGHVVPLPAQFCTWCGSLLRASSAERADEAERKQATILFADIVGSTELIAGLDAEAAMRRLNPTVAAMVQSVLRFGGTIVRILGDGVMAAFGAPRAQEGHALLACKAALAIQEAVGRIAGAPRIRVGLHSGEVVTGDPQGGGGLEQQLAGLTVHLANRIEQVAEPGSICLSDQCRQLVEAYCDTLALGPQSLKGYAEPTPVHRLLSLKPAVASDHFRGAELTSFRGRDEELAVLQRAMIEAEKGVASVVALSAPPGVGKSRLCYEFGEWCRRRQVEVLEARALIYGHATPLQPILEMLRSFFRLAPLDRPAHATEKIRRVLQLLGGELEDELPILRDFLGVGGEEEAHPPISSTVRDVRLREIVRKLIKVAGRRPTAILIEDLHWLDPASEGFMKTVVNAIDGTHIVLVVNFRPPYDAEWLRSATYRRLELSELSTPDIEQVVANLLGGSGEALKQACADIADQSGGNPFFAEELVRALAERGVLAGERGAYRLVGSMLDTNLPPTLEAVIGARIDRLEDREKSVLQIGAVIGKEFPLEILRKVAVIPPSDLETVLDRLCDAGLIQPRTTPAGSGFAFRHPLIQEVAYAMQLRARRTKLHSSVADAIERSEWGRLDEFAGLLTHHREAAGELLSAAMHLQRAARWVGRTNSAEAIKHWKKVRTLLSGQPQTEITHRLRALASGQILSAGWREGMLAEEAKPYADEALRYARQSGDESYEPMLLGSYGRIVGATGRADDYVALASQALALTAQTKEAGRTAALGGMLSQAYWLAGLLREALAANDAALAAVGERRSTEETVTLGLSVRQLLGLDVGHWIQGLRTRILVWLGRFDEAESAAERLIGARSSQTTIPVTQYIPHVALLEKAAWVGDAEAAARHARRVADCVEATSIPYLQVVALWCAGLARSAANDFAGATRDIGAALEFARRAKAGLEFEPRLLSSLAEAHHGAGEFAAAARIASEAIDLARRRTHRFSECQALLTRAAALLAFGGGISAEEPAQLLARAEALLDETGGEALRPRLAQLRAAVR